MSEIARELKMLFFMDYKFKHGNPYIKISELADYLEVSERQVRRYREDLNQNEFYIENKFGPDGGYRLIEGLDKSLMIPDNIMLALSISAKNNASLIKSLHDLPVVPNITKRIDGDSFITDHTIDVLSVISEAIAQNKRVHFDYEHYDKQISIDVEPYKIIYAYHSYYLRGVSTYNHSLRKYDSEKINNIVITDLFEPDKEIIKQTDNDLLVFGIVDTDNEQNQVLHLKYHSQSDAKIIDRYFECKGSIDYKNMIYTVTIRPSTEAFYNVFALHNKVEIMDADIKKRYINYIKHYLNEIEG